MRSLTAVLLVAACATTPPSEPRPEASVGVPVHSKDELMSVILAHRADLGSCAQEARQREPRVSGKLVVAFTIAPTGLVSRVEILSTEVANTVFGRCVAWQVLPRMRFSPAEREDRITFPFKF